MKEPRFEEPNGPTYTGGGMRSHAILIVLFLLYMSDYADRWLVSSMLSFIQSDWNLSDAQAGALMSVVITCITLFTIPASVLIDRWSRRKMVAVMVFLWSLASLACAFTRNYTQLLIARAFIGIGESGYAPAGSAMLAGAYPEGRRAKVMGIWNASIPLGIGIAMVAGGLIAKNWGWHHAFGLVAVPGMLLALAAWFLPDYKTVRAEESVTGYGGFREFLRKAAGVLRVPALVFTYLGFAMNVAATTAFGYWLPTYFERTGLVEQGEGGPYTTTILGLVLVGAPLGGFLSDVWHRKRREARLIFPALTSAVAAIVLALALLLPGSTNQIYVLVCFGIFVTCFIAPAAAVTQDLVHPGLRAFSYGMCVFVQHVCGDMWSPLLVGWISDHAGLEQAMRVIPIFGLLAAACFFAASKFYIRDLSRVERVALVSE